MENNFVYRSWECIIWKDYCYSSSFWKPIWAADTSIGITFSITLLLAKPLFTCQRNILLGKRGCWEKGFLGSQNQESKSGIHQLSHRGHWTDLVPLFLQKVRDHSAWISFWLCPSPAVNKICIQWGAISSPFFFYGGLIKDSRINGAELLCPECISMFFGHLSFPRDLITGGFHHYHQHLEELIIGTWFCADLQQQGFSSTHQRWRNVNGLSFPLANASSRIVNSFFLWLLSVSPICQDLT